MGKRFILKRMLCLLCCAVLLGSDLSVTALAQGMEETEVEVAGGETGGAEVTGEEDAEEERVEEAAGGEPTGSEDMDVLWGETVENTDESTETLGAELGENAVLAVEDVVPEAAGATADDTELRAVEVEAESDAVGAAEVETETELLEVSEGLEEEPEVAGQVMAFSLTDVYVDGDGNEFTYVVDDNGNAVITQITVSGGNLWIPSSIDGYPVTAVGSELSCVVANPGTKISQLTIDCEMVGCNAFKGTVIGTLIIGENVSSFEQIMSSTGSYPVWGQFAEAVIGKVVFRATELKIAISQSTSSQSCIGPFYQAAISDLEIGENVVLIPENLFRNAVMELGTVALNAERIGAYAFAGEEIHIEHLMIGENVKTLEECSNSSSIYHYWMQFASATIDVVTLNAAESDLGHTFEVGSTNYEYAPFLNATVGKLEIGEGVTKIPEAFMKQVKLTQEKLELHVKRIGAYAFAGEEIEIGTLVLGTEVEEFEESYYSSSIYHYRGQFQNASIGTFMLYAGNISYVNVSPVGLTNYVYGPFQYTSVSEVWIDPAVEVIPEYFFFEAEIDFGNFELHTPVIGAYAFAGATNTFDSLMIGSEVTTFTESYFSTTLYHYWNQFKSCTISYLEYSADYAETVHDVADMSSSSTYIYGIFNAAQIGEMKITDNVRIIPDYLLKDANATITELMLDLEEIGAMSFCSSSITVQRVVIEEGVLLFCKSDRSTVTYDYWANFGYATVDEVIYKATNAVTEDAAAYAPYEYGVFYNAKVGSLTIAENVESIPAHFFTGVTLTQDTLELHVKTIGTGAFASEKLTIGTLIIGEEVEAFEGIVEGSLIYFRQFVQAKIGTLQYDAPKAVTGTSCYRGVFESATIGSLEIGEGVEEIPNYLLRNSIMSLDSLEVNVPVIGYGSFYSQNISIGELTIGEDVTTFTTNSSGNSLAFDYCRIGKLLFKAREAQLDQLSGNYYGPFANYCVVGEIVFDEGVTVIPYGCFKGAQLDLDVVTIENADIGYGAFYSSGISIGQLNIGRNVSFVGMKSNQLNCFHGAKIGELNYNSNAVPVNWVTGTSAGFGMFSYAEISQLNIGEDVEVIPEYWFYVATMTQEELIVPCNWGAYAFNSSAIKIGRLVLCGEIDSFYSRSSKNYGFASGTYGTVVYDIPSAKYEPDTASAYGIFGSNTITDFIVTERVSYIDNKILRNLKCTNCYVNAVFAEEGYSTQSFTTSDLPVSENLFIHYNSDFKYLFETKATNKNWLCEDYFDKSYGDKFFNEETGTYDVTVYKSCSVCGYEEESVEELDASYDLFLSIPVGIALSFDSENKCYSGSACVYAYGRLGSAYDGVMLLADKESGQYGAAVMGEQVFDFSGYMSVGFGNAGEMEESVCFDSGQISDNKAVLEGAAEMQLFTSQMEVSVRGIAFAQGGAGEYQIQIPLKISFY